MKKEEAAPFLVRRNIRLQRIQNWSELARQADWSVSALAKLCGVSVRALQRYFLDYMGKSPKAWISDQRQQHAIELLQAGCSVKETAMAIGYNHSTHFSREFKKRWGHSPATMPLCLKQVPNNAHHQQLKASNTGQRI